MRVIWGEQEHSAPDKSWSAGDAVVLKQNEQYNESFKAPGVWLLNAGAAKHKELLTKSWQEARWRRAGLMQRKQLTSVRLYRVVVCHLQIVHLARIAPGKEQETLKRLNSDYGVVSSGRDQESGASWSSDRLLQLVAKHAVFALYALEIDIGEIIIALGGDGRSEPVRAMPDIANAELKRAAADEFIRWYRQTAKSYPALSQKLLLGADPEFALLTAGGKIAMASRYFGSGKGGAAGADTMRIAGKLLYPIAELRPEPASDPEALIVNVRRLLQYSQRRITNSQLRWVAGAMPVPGLALGGHIHISGVPLTTRLLRLFDSCIAYPLALVEDEAGRKRRPRYGMLGDYRLQAHGGFEYRTLPSWLVSPLAAKAAVALAALCAKEALTLAYVPAAEEKYEAAYYNGDRTELQAGLDDIIKVVTSAGQYAAYAKWIDPLFEAAKKGRVWNEQSDFREKWRISARK
ncbi:MULTISPECIES: putative amidoligase domain-containing protein [unclassified Paenibacillus]|uniref:putative amidoligase domain-containing protein n=1 Tax=unclassified Paenibacillus TaxID=185978 RepID=UPI002F3F1ADB